MIRKLTDHRVNGLNEALHILVIDNPGPGGANHKYVIELYPSGFSTDPAENVTPAYAVSLCFQNGPIARPDDMNGLSGEALLAVLIDRMRGFQYTRDDTGNNFTNKPGPYACRENAIALTHLEEALFWLQKRTRDRMARGVEGTMQK